MNPSERTETNYVYAILSRTETKYSGYINYDNLSMSEPKEAIFFLNFCFLLVNRE